MPPHSWTLLARKSDLSPADFILFKTTLLSSLQRPENLTGLDGPWPLRHRQAWETWLNVFINNGIGDQFWGSGKGGWCLVEDRYKVRCFVKEAVHYAGVDLRREGFGTGGLLTRRIRGSFGLISGEGVLEGYDEDFEIEESRESTQEVEELQASGSLSLRAMNSSPVISHESRAGKIATRVMLDADRKGKSTLLHINESEAMGAATHLLGAGQKRKRTSAARVESRPPEIIIIDADTGGVASKAPINEQKITQISHNTTNTIHPTLPKAKAWKPAKQIPERQQRLKPPAKKSETKAAPSLSRAESKTKIVPPAGLTHPDADDYVLESIISGSGDSRIRLIYGYDVPSLSDLVEKIRRKHGLAPGQDIRGLRVRIGDKVFGVDMEDQRDWKYVSGFIRANGLRAEMVVETA